MWLSSSLPLFRNRFIRVIIASQLFLQIGIWIRNFSILLYVMEMTKGNAFAISMISVAEFAPIFVFSFIGGTFADRWRPKRLMIACDLLSAASVMVVLLTLIFGSWKAIFFATLFSAIFSQFSQPAGLKLFKRQVPANQIQAGMSLYQTIASVFVILGPILGTFVYQKCGIHIGIAIMGFSFLMSAAVLMLLPSDQDVTEEEKNYSTILQEMAAGISYVLSNKILRLLGACFLTVGLAGGLIQPLIIFLITEQLGLEKEYLQWFMTVSGVGIFLGGTLSLFVAKVVSPQWMIILSMLISSVTVILCGFSTVLWITLTAQFISSIFTPFAQIGINTMLMQNTESSYIGRVNGLLGPLFIGAMLITMSMAGVLKKALSFSTIYGIAGILFFVGLLFVLPLHRLQTVEER